MGGEGEERWKGGRATQHKGMVGMRSNVRHAEYVHAGLRKEAARGIERRTDIRLCLHAQGAPTAATLRLHVMRGGIT